MYCLFPHGLVLQWYLAIMDPPVNMIACMQTSILFASTTKKENYYFDLKIERKDNDG